MESATGIDWSPRINAVNTGTIQALALFDPLPDYYFQWILQLITKYI